MKCDAVRFTRHAFERLFARAITPDALIRIIKEGEVIASYPDDVPFPSVLILGFEERESVHVMVARDPGTGICFVVTVIPIYIFGAMTLKRGSNHEVCNLQSGETQPGTVTVTLLRGDTTVLIKGTPAEVCQNCAEYYLDEVVARKVYNHAEGAVQRRAEVEILRYVA